MVSDRSPVGSDAAAVARRWADALAARLPRPVADLLPLVTGPVERLATALHLDEIDLAAAPRTPEGIGEVLGALVAGFAHGLSGEHANQPGVFGSRRIGLWITDAHGTVVGANQVFAGLVGATMEEVVGRPLPRRVLEPDAVEQLASGAVEHLRVHRTWPDDESETVHTDVLALRTAGGTDSGPWLVGLVERTDARAAAALFADHDALTGLLDRAALFDALAADPDTLIGLVYLDLDGFKAVNDTVGNDGGDVVLRAVAQRLDDELSRDGHVVARTGGDEYAVLVHGASDDARRDLDELQRVSHRVLAIVRRPVRIGGHRVAVTASAGVVRRNRERRRHGAELMRAAGTTLSRAKKAGRDRIALFDPDLHLHDVSRFAMTARMPQALADGEFSLEYQPLVRLDDGTLVGVEALARWTLPGGERIAPDRFVPLAEETGMIVPLGRWVLAEACRQAAAWLRAGGPPLIMSVNLAARQVDDPGIVDAVARALKQNDLPAQLLQLELTESEVMGPTTGTRATLEALAGLGVRLAIDDFGTGYSNLAYLRSLPVHALKLAGPFVTGAGSPDGTVDVEITSMLVGLAHALGLTVTAESVETAEQAAQLRELGCDIGQGWFYSPAVGADAVPGLAAGPLGGTA